MSAAIIIAQARVEADRIEAVLAAVADVVKAKDVAQQEGLSDAAECIALEALVAAEDKLIDLIADPGFSAYLSAVAKGLRDMLRLSLVAENVS